MRVLRLILATLLLSPFTVRADDNVHQICIRFLAALSKSWSQGEVVTAEMARFLARVESEARRRATQDVARNSGPHDPIIENVKGDGHLFYYKSDGDLEGKWLNPPENQIEALRERLTRVTRASNDSDRPTAEYFLETDPNSIMAKLEGREPTKTKATLNRRGFLINLATTTTAALASDAA